MKSSLFAAIGWFTGGAFALVFSICFLVSGGDKTALGIIFALIATLDVINGWMQVQIYRERRRWQQPRQKAG